MNNNNYSELLYLVIDGEANAVEKSTVFSALSNDADLQEEFYDALQMRSVAFNDAGSMTPPAFIGRNILKAAGVTTALGALTSSPLLTSIAKVLPSLFGAALGALLTFVIMKSTNSDIPTFENKQAATRSEQTGNSSIKQTDNSSIKQMASEIPTVITRQSEPKIITRTVYVPVERFINSEKLPAVSSLSATEPSVQKQLQAAEQDPSSSVPQISEVTDDKLIRTNRNTQAVTTITADVQDNPRVDHSDKVPFMLQMNGIQDFRTYSANLGVSQNRAFNNISASLFYKLSDNSSTGIAVGQEDLPLFVQYTNQQFVPRQSIFWAGGAFRYEFGSLVSFADMRPYGQTTVAVTQVGPLTKTSLGMRWMPDTRVSLHVGAEVSGLLFNNESNRYQMVSKIGFTYGLDIVF